RARSGAHLTRPQLPPQLLPGCRSEREQIRVIWTILSSASIRGHVALQHLHVNFAIIEQRAGREGPLKGEFAVFLLQVSFPKFLSFQIKSRQLTVPVENNNS